MKNLLPATCSNTLVRLRPAGWILLGAFCLEGATLHGQQVAGTLDAAFAADVPGGSIKAIAVQPDGKILIGGGFGMVSGQPRYNLARLNGDGSVEGTGTFDPGVIHNPNSSVVVESVVVQPDGKILIAGGFTTVNGQARNRIARLLADGTLEDSATFNPGTGVNNGTVWCMARQADGKILIGGDFTLVNGEPRNRIARLNADGTLESTATFNTGSGVTNNSVLGMVVQPDGKILIGGPFTAVNAQPRGGIARLNADGTLESTATFNVGTGISSGGFVRGLAVQPDGKILLGGGFNTVQGQPRLCIARLLGDGSVESTATFNPGTGANFLRCLVLQPDGKVLIGGTFTTANGQPRNRIARLLADGTLEGTATFNAGAGANNVVHAMALQPGGGIVMGGDFTTVDSQPRGRVARLANEVFVTVDGFGDSWKWRNPLPQGAGLKTLVVSGGTLIATGRAGTILTTTDGMNWTSRVSGTRNFLAAAAASGPAVVAVGREGDIVTSADGGASWSLRFSDPGVQWFAVTHGGGGWVAVGSQWTNTGPYYITGVVMTSSDGVTWTRRTVPNTDGTSFTCAVWTGTRFIVGGNNWSGLPEVTTLATSENGITWTPRPMPTPMPIAALAWTGSRAVAVCYEDILTSVDGISWAAANHLTGVNFQGVMWTGSELLAWPWAGQSVYTSPTGEIWTPRLVQSPELIGFGAAAADGATLVLGGDRGLLFRSADSGASWNPVPPGLKQNINALSRFAGRWVAVGADGLLASSADGVSWLQGSPGTRSRLRALAWHNGLWVAGGREEGSPATNATIHSLFTSTDGLTWTDRTFSTPLRATHWPQIYSIIRAGTQWVAAEFGAVLTSPDGITWQEHPMGRENRSVAWNGSMLVVVGGDEGDQQGWTYSSTNGGVAWNAWAQGFPFLRGVAWTGTQFIAVGDFGAIYTSPSGFSDSWTQRTSGATSPLRGILADAERIVIVGGYSGAPVVLTSVNGINWTPHSVPTDQLLYSISKAGSLYVATGYDGVVLTSPDVANWTRHDTGTTHELYAAAWDGQQLLVTGEGGAILANTAPAAIVPWKGIARLPGPGFGVRLTWPAAPGRLYDVEMSTSLGPPWQPIPGSPRLGGGAEEFLDFTDPDPGGGPGRTFFRVRQRP